MAEEISAIRHSLTRLGELAAHPGAYGIIVIYAVLWFGLDRASLDWHGVATLAVWSMTLLTHGAPRYAGAAGEARRVTARAQSSKQRAH